MEQFQGLSWEQVEYLKYFYEQNTGSDAVTIFKDGWQESKPEVVSREAISTVKEILELANELGVASELIIERLKARS